MELAHNPYDNENPGWFKRRYRAFKGAVKLATTTEEGQYIWHTSSLLSWLQAFPIGYAAGKIGTSLPAVWSKVTAFASALWATITLN